MLTQGWLSFLHCRRRKGNVENERTVVQISLSSPWGWQLSKKQANTTEDWDGIGQRLHWKFGAKEIRACSRREWLWDFTADDHVGWRELCVRELVGLVRSYFVYLCFTLLLSRRQTIYFWCEKLLLTNRSLLEFELVAILFFLNKI